MAKKDRTAYFREYNRKHGDKLLAWRIGDDVHLCLPSTNARSEALKFFKYTNG